MRLILFILLLANLATSQQQRYKITNQKIIGWSILAIGGAADGITEATQFDRHVFEVKFDVDSKGFWGSESYLRAYKGGDPDNGYKSWYAKNFGAWDAYHLGDDIRKLGYISGGLVITLGSKQRKIHYLYDFLIGFAISAATKRAAMWWIHQ